MKEEEILKQKSEILTRDVRLLRLKSTFTILSMEFFKVYAEKEEMVLVERLTKKFELLIKDLLEIEES